MASPLFSGFIPATWFLKLDSVSPDQEHSQSEEGKGERAEHLSEEGKGKDKQGIECVAAISY